MSFMSTSLPCPNATRMHRQVGLGNEPVILAPVSLLKKLHVLPVQLIDLSRESEKPTRQPARTDNQTGELFAMCIRSEA